MALSQSPASMNSEAFEKGVRVAFEGFSGCFWADIRQV